MYSTNAFKGLLTLKRTPLDLPKLNGHPWRVSETCFICVVDGYRLQVFKFVYYRFQREFAGKNPGEIMQQSKQLLPLPSLSHGVLTVSAVKETPSTSVQAGDKTPSGGGTSCQVLCLACLLLWLKVMSITWLMCLNLRWEIGGDFSKNLGGNFRFVSLLFYFITIFYLFFSARGPEWGNKTTTG